MNSGFFELSLSIQIALASGYLAYITAYAGLRRGHATQDAIFISLVFSVVALLCFELVPIEQTYLRAAMASASSLVSGIVWRKIGRPLWLWMMQKTGVHREDGVHAPWDILVQTDRKVVSIRRGTRSCGLDGFLLGLPVPWEQFRQA